MQLNKLGIGIEQVAAALTSAHANRPKGELANGSYAWQVTANDQLFLGDKYKNIIAAQKKAGEIVRLQDVADVRDSVEDVRNAGLVNGTPAVLMIVFRQPGANIIQAVARVRAILPQLQTQIPANIHLQVVLDRTTTVRASVKDIQFTLCLSIALFVMLVFLFLLKMLATLFPSSLFPIWIIVNFDF